MDPRDLPIDPTSAAECDACQRPVPRDRVRVLARRDDVVFAELPCAECGSVGLAIFVGATDDGPATGEAAASPPLAGDDVLDMHLFLAGWSGDLRSLVDPATRRGPSEAA
jgi:hypothetical protein